MKASSEEARRNEADGVLRRQHVCPFAEGVCRQRSEEALARQALECPWDPGGDAGKP